MICANCGKPFEVYGQRQRIYCSRACYHEMRFVKKERGEQIFNEELSCLSGPKKIYTISGEKIVEKTIATNHIKETVLDSITVCELQEALMRRIFLICGPLTFQGKIDAFAARIPAIMTHNLEIGDVFVFCNHDRYQLSVLQWQGQAFSIMFRRTEKQKYPWPVFDEIRVIEVRRSDMEMLMEYPRFLQRIKGLPAPDFWSENPKKNIDIA